MKIKNDSLIFSIVFVLVLLGSVFATYYRLVIAQNYQVHVQIECDPEIEDCFIYYCDPEWEECTGDEWEDTWYYKLIERQASVMASCDPAVKNCDEKICEEDDPDCEVINCSQEWLEDGEECMTPEKFPGWPEGWFDCEEGDAECALEDSENKESIEALEVEKAEVDLELEVEEAQGYFSSQESEIEKVIKVEE